MQDTPSRAKTLKATQIYWMLSRAGLTAARNGDGPLAAQITKLLIQLGFDRNWPDPLCNAIAASIDKISKISPAAKAQTLKTYAQMHPDQFPPPTMAGQNPPAPMR